MTHFRCSCYSEGITIEKQDDGTFEFGYVHYSMQASKLVWKDRLRSIWRIISKGTYYTDMVILDKNKTKELTKFLNEALEEK